MVDELKPWASWHVPVRAPRHPDYMEFQVGTHKSFRAWWAAVERHRGNPKLQIQHYRNAMASHVSRPYRGLGTDLLDALALARRAGIPVRDLHTTATQSLWAEPRRPGPATGHDGDPIRDRFGRLDLDRIGRHDCPTVERFSRLEMA